MSQHELMIEFMKFDDALFLEEGFRREVIDKAVEVYQINQNDTAAGEGGSKGEPMFVQLGA